jgi:hypothetical protein
MAQNGLHDIIQVSPSTGAKVGSTIVTIGTESLNSLVYDSILNRLIVSGDGSGIYTVNVGAGTSTMIEPTTVHYDGIAISPDDSTLYAADVTNGRVVSINLTTDAITSLGAVTDPDGIAIGAGAHAGNIYVNTNLGDVIQINLTTLAQTIIASGGSRGDFVYVDQNGKLLITQSDSIVTFANTTVGMTPEPGTWAMLGLGLLLVVVGARRKTAARG